MMTSKEYITERDKLKRQIKSLRAGGFKTSGHVRRLKKITEMELRK